MSSKNPTDTFVLVSSERLTGICAGVCLHRMPSSSDDFTFAITTSDVNGRNTTIRNETSNCQISTSSKKYKRTFVPQKAVAISDLSFTNLYEVKDSDAQADIVQNFIRIFFVDLVYQSLIRWYAKVLWMYGECVL